MPKLALYGVCMLALVTALAGCYEEGFEYQAKAELLSTGNSGVSGSVIMGYGMGNPAFRMRIKLRGLLHDASYQVYLYDAPSCSASDLATSRRIDARSDNQGRAKEAWGFEVHPALLSGSFFGSAEQEFKLIAPRAPTIYSTTPDKYPTVVIAPANSASATSAPRNWLACATIVGPPRNVRPHM